MEISTAAISHFDQAMEIAGRTGNRAAEVMSLLDKGRVLCGLGRMTEGLALIDRGDLWGGGRRPRAFRYGLCLLRNDLGELRAGRLPASLGME